jgi:hypothetical protein
VNPLSIGSFFHEDLAYLAALEAKGKLTPDVERKQNAWWKLLLWYLNEDLKEVEQSLHGQPFLDWVPRQEGAADGTPVFDRIIWLERDRKVIGLVSPVLLVRPLPDENLSGTIWESPAPITDRVRSRLAELAKNLYGKLEETRLRGATPFCCKLAPIINARNIAPAANIPSSDVVLSPFAFLDPYTLDSTKIMVPTGDGAYLLPLCPNCSESLLPSTVNLEFGADNFGLRCRKCQTAKQFQLSEFGCAWVDGELVVWRDRTLQWADTTASVRMPPVPVVDANRGRVRFAYPALSALANIESRDLTFVVPMGSPFRSIDRVTDLNYANYLWPGDADPAAPVAAVPVPLRIENASLVRSARTRKINNTVEVTLELKGLPAAIRWIFIPSTISTSSIVIYPNPKNVPLSWSWFDIATDELRMRLPANAKAARSIGEHRVRTETTAAALPAIELSSASGSGGVTGSSCSLLLIRPDDRAAPAPAELFFGFDFGSSNTAMRFSLDGSYPNSRPLNSNDLRKSVAALTISPAFDQAADRVAPKGAGDGSSFQSFHCQVHHVARVTPTPCCNEFQTGDVLFKSDENWHTVRIQYVSEMLIHGLIGASPYFGQRRLNISGVFSYPLTFTSGRLEKFVSEVKTVVETVSAQTGGDPATAVAKTQFVDEATAGVASLGQPQASEVVLTADLGGGTLDVSIGRTTDGPEKDQIGSAEVGGSYFVRRGHNVGELQNYVTTVGKIARGEADRGEWANQKPHVERYYQLLFTFLETVLGSYIVRRHADHTRVEKVSVYPLGNGWRFHELMVNRMQVNPSAVVRAEIEKLTRNLAEAIYAKHNVTIDLQPQLVDNPKGAVAAGCLAVATRTGEHQAKEVRPRLPFGINAANGDTHVAWHELFHNEVADEAFVNDGLRFDEQELRARLQTPNGRNWAAEGFDAGALRGNLQTKAYYWEGAGFTRGPLQVLIETQWLPKA